VIFDTNVLIYLSKFALEPEKILKEKSAISVITKIEALGYHKLPADDKDYFTTVFDTINVIPVTNDVVDKATELRQQKKMSLGDCLIAATALLNGFELYTNNTADFIHIPGLTVINPLENY